MTGEHDHTLPKSFKATSIAPIPVPDAQTIKLEEPTELRTLIIDIPPSWYVWSVNPRGDRTFVTLKRSDGDELPLKE